MILISDVSLAPQLHRISTAERSSLARLRAVPLDKRFVNNEAHHDGDEMHRQTKYIKLSIRGQGTSKHAVRGVRACDVVVLCPLCQNQLASPRTSSCNGRALCPTPVIKTCYCTT